MVLEMDAAIPPSSFGPQNDNDNDNDTLREVPHPSNEGLALQARVYGVMTPLKRICFTDGTCTLARCASTNC